MYKIYRKNNNKLEYWETWEKGEDASVIHEGVVGEKGDTKVLENINLQERQGILKTEIKKRIEAGFRPIEEKDLKTLVIEYKINNNQGLDLLSKRNELESRLNEILGWVGLGHCDGGTSSQEEIEVFCLVVDYDLAFKLITEDISNSPFSDYSKIYEQS